MLDTEVLFNILKIAALFIGLSFIVFWVGLVWWVSQDVLTRTSDKIIVAAAVAMTAILGPVGVMFYLIIRPKQTMKESYGEMMEHEMMLRAAASTICPMCEHMTQEDFVNCPYCGTVLKKQCASCQKLVDMDWSYCPYCGQVATKPATPTINRAEIKFEPTTIHEIQKQHQIEQNAVKGIEKTLLEQTSNPSTITLKNAAQRKINISNAGQSALSLLRQTFGSQARPVTTNLESAAISSPEPTDQESQSVTEVNQGNQSPVAENKESSKKRNTKGRSNRRARK